MDFSFFDFRIGLLVEFVIMIEMSYGCFVSVDKVGQWSGVEVESSI